MKKIKLTDLLKEATFKPLMVDPSKTKKNYECRDCSTQVKSSTSKCPNCGSDDIGVVHTVPMQEDHNIDHEIKTAGINKLRQILKSLDAELLKNMTAGKMGQAHVTQELMRKVIRSIRDKGGHYDDVVSEAEFTGPLKHEVYGVFIKTKGLWQHWHSFNGQQDALNVISKMKKSYSRIKGKRPMDVLVVRYDADKYRARLNKNPEVSTFPSDFEVIHKDTV